MEQTLVGGKPVDRLIISNFKKKTAVFTIYIQVTVIQMKIISLYSFGIGKDIEPLTNLFYSNRQNS